MNEVKRPQDLTPRQKAHLEGHKLLYDALKHLTIASLTTIAIVCFIVLPAIALSQLAISVRRERLSRPPQTSVPVVVGLNYKTAQIKLRDASLNIRVLANRHDLQIEPGIIIAQTPQGGERVDLRHCHRSDVERRRSGALIYPNPLQITPHRLAAPSGHSSQLVFDANDRNAQFLPTIDIGLNVNHTDGVPTRTKDSGFP